MAPLFPLLAQGSDPPLLAALLFLLAGFSALFVGGEGLVRGAAALSVRLRLTPAVIGLTVMALGTSLPERGARCPRWVTHESRAGDPDAKAG